MSDFSPKQLRIISYALSHLCRDLDSKNISPDSTLRTKIHTWKHGRALYRLRDVEFSPDQALTTLGVAVKKLEERDE